MPQLTTKGFDNDDGILRQIIELNRSIELLQRAGIAVTRRVVANIEARLISIISQIATSATNDPSDINHYCLWLTANRREIVEIMDIFNSARTTANFPRGRVGKEHLSKAYDEVRRHFEDVTSVYGNFTNSLRESTALYYSLRAGAAATVATGVSAFSFVSPPIGVIVTPVVAGVGALSTAAAFYYGGKQGEREGPILAEETIRSLYGLQ